MGRKSGETGEISRVPWSGDEVTGESEALIRWLRSRGLHWLLGRAGIILAAVLPLSEGGLLGTTVFFVPIDAAFPGSPTRRM